MENRKVFCDVMWRRRNARRCDVVTIRRDVICDVDGRVGQVKVMSRLESAQRRAVLFPQDGTVSTAAPLTDVEVVIVKDRWVGDCLLYTSDAADE